MAGGRHRYKHNLGGYKISFLSAFSVTPPQRCFPTGIKKGQITFSTGPSILFPQLDRNRRNDNGSRWRSCLDRCVNR